MVADVYPAGEEPIKGMNKEALVAGLRYHGHRQVEAVEDPNALAETISRIARLGDLVVFLGAGSITHWANALPEGLRKLDEK